MTNNIRSKTLVFILVISIASVCSQVTWAQAERSIAGRPPTATVSITDRSFVWPKWQQWKDVALLKEYNTRVVVLSVAMLGIASGLVGSFTLLRKRALIGDALAHASLPGIAIAFLVATGSGVNGKSLPILLTGATLGGIVGVGLILLVQQFTRLKQDAILGIVLSVFFGIGTALLGVIQQLKTGSAAGLETFIYGKTASIKFDDASLIFCVSLGSIIVCSLFYKELKVLCFDSQFANASGLSTILLDLILMAMVVAVTMVGLQAVGLILVVALLVIPPAAARFWTDSLLPLTLLSCVFGLLGGVLGAIFSALFPRLPSGAMVVLVCAFVFILSMSFGKCRGIVPRAIRRRSLNRSIDRQHLLRGLFELLEKKSLRDLSPALPRTAVDFERLLILRSWSAKRLKMTIKRAKAQEHVRTVDGKIKLTQSGYVEAARLTRQHRLWELFLIHYADIAPARVDRDADDIEHVLEPEIVDELESLLNQSPVCIEVPADPHHQEASE